MASNVIEQIDPLNFSVVRIEPLFDETPLGNATGFFVSGELNGRQNHWLVSNWHVLAGRNADDPCKVLHSKGALPNRLRLSLILKSELPEYSTLQPGTILIEQQIISLYDNDGNAMWYQHQERNSRDVAVVNPGAAFEKFKIIGINELSKQNDMVVQIGNDVFILGYPLGFSYFVDTPIWKKGSIASEPNLETPGSKTRVVVDATTRQGMSGAPVIMRKNTHYLAEDGRIKKCPNATRWIGIYASRPSFQTVDHSVAEDRRAEIGYFYKMSCVIETINEGVRGPNFGNVP